MRTKLIREGQFTDRCNVSNCPNSATHVASDKLDAIMEQLKEREL